MSKLFHGLENRSELLKAISKAYELENSSEFETKVIQAVIEHLEKTNPTDPKITKLRESLKSKAND